MKDLSRFLAVACVVFLSLACGKSKPDKGDVVDGAVSTMIEATEPQPDDLKSAEETVSGLNLIEVEVHGFSELDSNTRRAIWHFDRAARAADEILYSQLGPENLRIKALLDAIVRVETHIPVGIRQSLLDYSVHFYLSHGVYDFAKRQKIETRFIPGQLAAAAQIAMNRGEDLGLSMLDGVPLDATQLQQLEALLALIKPWLFDKGVSRRIPLQIVTSDKDDTSKWLHPLYPAVESKELEGWKGAFGFNARVVKEGSKLVEQVFRAGDDGVPPGAFSKPLGAAVNELQSGISLMSEADRGPFVHLMQFLRRGDHDSLAAYYRLVNAKRPLARLYMGFHDTWIDLRGQIGAYRSVLAIRDLSYERVAQKVAENAHSLLKGLPWSDGGELEKIKYAPQDLQPLIAISSWGDARSHFPIEMTVPPEEGLPWDDLRREVFFTNVEDARDRARGNAIFELFSPSSKVAERRSGCRAHVRLGMDVLRRELGDGVIMGLKPMDEDSLSAGASVDEEESLVRGVLRDTIALWAGSSMLSVNDLLLPGEECKLAIWDDFACGFVEKLGQKENGTADESVATHRIVFSELIRDEAIEMRLVDEHWQVFVSNYGKARKTVGRLAVRAHRAMQKNKVNDLVSEWANSSIDIPSAWVVDARKRRVDLASKNSTVYVFPKLQNRMLPASSGPSSSERDITLRYWDSPRRGLLEDH